MSDQNEERSPFTGPPTGLRRSDSSGLEIIDAMAGRQSALGFGNEAIVEAIRSTAGSYLGEARASDTDNVFFASLRELIGGSDSVLAESCLLCATADEAVETAIQFARQWKKDAYRTVALIGSDHGRTMACRTASGQPSLHDGLGPMIAGFAHVPADDVDALAATVDEGTACLLIAPVDLADGARVLSADYLQAARDICDKHQVALIIDESRLCFGASGQPFSFSFVSDVRVDGVILSAGLFGGLPGGVLIASDRFTQSAGILTGHLPLQRAVVSATLAEMKSRGLPQSFADTMENFAVALAEKIGQFEFVRDANVCGMTIGVVTDIDADAIVRSANEEGVRMEAAGDTSVRMQLPLVADKNDLAEIVQCFGQSLERIERETADALQS